MNETCAALLGFVFVVGTCMGGSTTDAKENNEDGPINPTFLSYTTDLDENYRLRWNFNSTHIVFQTRVKTKGYIGFGISDHGSMFPSDVIIAWVKEGQVHFKDRHAIGHFLPPVDASQDWHLISGSEDDEYTTITMMRQLDTCDSDDDMVISHGTTRLIYSYSAIDPESDNSIFYHGVNRGSKSILLIGPPASDKKQIDLPDDIITVDFLNQNYSVPSKDTTYNCQGFKLPPLNGTHHIIRYEPVIQKGHEKLVHHMDMYFCRPDITDDVADTQYECYNDALPKGFENCNHIILAWSIGGTAFDFPAHVGYPLGGPDDPIYFKLETHYNNPQMIDGFVDSSGLRIFLTKQLRQNDAGMMEVGVNVDKFQIIPPHFHDFLSRGVCVEGCIEKGLGDDRINIIAVTLHSHLLGRRLLARHVRNGTELPPIVDDPGYDFNYQEMRLLTEERTVMKGDALMTDCHFDSSKRSVVTYGGLSTREEMCLSFLLYYPKKRLSLCASRPRYNITDQSSIFKAVEQTDFTDPTARKNFERMISDTETMYGCLVNDDMDIGMINKPVIKHPFVPENKCKKT